VLGEGWEGLLVRAMELGMDLASGPAPPPLGHSGLARCRRASRPPNRRRSPPDARILGRSGVKRPGKRLLTVGTDCSIGKMFTALALEKG